ncbi:MAG: hypothetical protein A2Y71_12250 [Bacteroidetes bacterium RBG_13_42_15]|nr:MAG: hypothetical protein A2Y71_12250 [Bacteroidetes bacterium RBG_13_42_15]
MKLSKLTTFRWILLFLSPLLLTLMMSFIDQEDLTAGDSNNFFYFMIAMIFWIVCTGAIVGLFIYQRTTISRGIKIFLITFIPASLIVYVFFRIFPSTIGDLINNSVFIVIGFIYTIIYCVILLFICYLEKIEIILLGLIPVIITGFIINRFGISEGGFIIPFAFFLSWTGFVILVFKSVPVYKSDKTKGIIFILFYSVIGCLNALFLIKFLAARPALNNLYDTIGVVIFLLACLALFIILPFSNFTDWAKTHKLSFKRLIINPLILFLIIFSLKFLLPDKIYRSIFFKEFSQKERVHFNMEDYEVDFSGR